MKPYAKIDQLIAETKMVGRFGLSALSHPFNHPTADLIELVSGDYGLRVACDIDNPNPYLFHVSQLPRILL